MIRPLVITALLLLAALCTAPLGAQQDPTPADRVEGDTIYLEQVASVPPVVDGNLDDECWQTAVTLSGFLQTRPVAGAPAACPTEVLLCRGKHHLYFAIRCHDDPSRISAFQTRPDGSFEDRDDSISIQIDSFHDHRRAYEFAINPLGTKVDIKWDNLDWDGVWEVAAKTCDWGWGAEGAIDLCCLSYPSRAEVVGINFFREAQRSRERSAWRYLPGASTWDQRLFGHLRGFAFDALAARPRPQAKAYWLSVLERNGGDTDFTASQGLDARYDFQSNLQANLALNPDFSDVEAVYETVDQSYTERWLPEKRPFFTEGGEFFDSWLFYARRVPDFDFGAKAYGKTSGTSFGALSTYYDADRRSDAIVTLTQDVGTVNSISATVVAKSQPADHNLALGTGGYWELLRRPRIGLTGQYGVTRSQALPTDSSLYVSMEARSNDNRWSLWSEYQDTGPDFYPTDGYEPETDLRRLSNSLGYHLHSAPSRKRTRFLNPHADLTYERATHQDGRPLEENVEVNFSADYTENLSLECGRQWYRRAVATDTTEIIYADRRQSLSLQINPLERLAWTCGLVWGRVQDAAYSLISAGASFESQDNVWGARLLLEQRFHHSAEEGNATALDLALSYEASKNSWLALRNYYLREAGTTNNNFSAVGRFLWPSGRELVVVTGNPDSERTASRLAVKYILPF